METSGRLLLGYDAAAGTFNPVGPVYENLTDGERQEIVWGLREQLRQTFNELVTAPAPLTFYETWDTQAAIPVSYAMLPTWISDRLAEAKSDAATYEVAAPASEIRYVQNGDEIICEHYYVVQRNGEDFHLQQGFNAGADEIDVTVFAVARI